MKNNEILKYEGKEYLLIQRPYIEGTADEGYYYLAPAIDNEGNQYEVKWELSIACDWDYPVDVRECD